MSPLPASTRWQPLRAGLIDLFYYDSEEFWFRDGRLLLRGNNGTGKSKVLALTLPFLLDGDLAAHRVEPDADPKKRMEWNLLLGGEHPYPERLGYTWLEFGRVDETGTAHFRTIGCGLKAVSGRGIARHWFFVTSQRVGEELRLVDATGTALTRDRLTDALGEHGTAYDRARDYRRAVDEALFSFGEQRYTALVNLLVQLRQPQLSKRPSEKALSDALTESLPPLDQAVVADVADAFRSLEENRDALIAMTEARDAATSFLTHYSRYARIAARRRAAGPRSAHSTYERISRDLFNAQAAFTQAEEELALAVARLAELTETRQRLTAREQTLRSSPEMRSARELELAGEKARQLQAASERTAADRDRSAGQVAGLRERHAAAAARSEQAASDLATARASALDAAVEARIDGDHRVRVDALLDADLSLLQREAEQLVSRQQTAIRHVLGLLSALEEAGRRVVSARQRVSDLDGEATELADRRSAAEQAVIDAGRALVSGVRTHLDEVSELSLPDAGTTLAQLELWVETLDGPNPAVAAATSAGQAVFSELARADADFEALEREGGLRASELSDEMSRLERGEDSAPPIPYTRSSSRTGRPGAPLWQLVDFVDSVSSVDRAGIEAALEASGILDAWVTPAGDLESVDGDILVRAGSSVDVSLASVLRPAVDRADPFASSVSDDAVAAVLAGIGFGEHGSSWVDAAGHFRLGVLEGQWQKESAAYVGRGAREAARRLRLEALRTELAALRGELVEISTARAELATRRATLSAEIAALPGDDPLRHAHVEVGALVQEHQRLTVRQARAREDAEAAVSSENNAQSALEEGARDADLPADRAALSEVDSAVGRYRVCLAQLWPAVRTLAEANRAAAEIAADLADAEVSLAELCERAGIAAADAVAAQERHQTLQRTVGAAVAELERQLAEVADDLRDNDAEQASAGEARNKALNARGKAEGRSETLSAELEVAAADREAAAESFRRFAGTGLLAIALPELDVPDLSVSWAPVPAMRLARRVNEELESVNDDDNTWDRAQHRVNQELKTLQETLSRHGNRASGDLREDGVVVEVEFQGRPTSVPELAKALEVEVADRERLLNAREREILENHLVNEVASTLQELITAAERQVMEMNAELKARPTSTGMQLRLLWQPREDGPVGLAAARERLLRQTSDAWTDADREAVGEFLQQQIAEVRGRNASGTWLEHLTEALDYRQWNRFVIQRHQNNQWRSASGPASGGERVLAASVPLFAAASSHYASAGNPHAPRLVTLDEAFAGVDDNARAKYLGLLAAFDLDVVMTSEREWGCYPEVPGLAISQLSRIDGVPAVLVTNWEWDGAKRTMADRPEVTVSAPAKAPEPPPEQQDLWS